MDLTGSYQKYQFSVEFEQYKSLQESYQKLEEENQLVLLYNSQYSQMNDELQAQCKQSFETITQLELDNQRLQSERYLLVNELQQYEQRDTRAQDELIHARAQSEIRNLQIREQDEEQSQKLHRLQSISFEKETRAQELECLIVKLQKQIQDLDAQLKGTQRHRRPLSTSSERKSRRKKYSNKQSAVLTLFFVNLLREFPPRNHSPPLLPLRRGGYSSSKRLFTA